MNKDQRKISRKLRVLRNAEETGHELKSGVLAPVAGPHLDSQDYYLLTRTTPSVPARKLTDWLLEQATEFFIWQKAFGKEI